MNIMTYLFIFFAKVIENSIATLRLIVVSNGKKLLGAILNFIMSLAWVISTGLVVINIKEDPFKIVIFALGCFIGSYIGSYMEEKMALGSNMLFVITKPNYISIIKNKLEELKYTNYSLDNEEKSMLLIMVERKKRKEILNMIREVDKEAIIISEVARQLAFK